MDRELSADKEVVIEVDWTLGQAAPHIATITAQSTPLSWRLQAALELTMCELPILQDTYMIVDIDHFADVHCTIQPRSCPQ